MSRLTIRNDSTSSDFALKLKRIQVNGKEFRTPAKAIETDKLTKHDDVRDAARGVNEVYVTATAEELRNEARGRDRKIARRLDSAVARSHDGEVNIGFVGYRSQDPIGRREMDTLVETASERVDILATPLFTDLTDAALEKGDHSISPAGALEVIDDVTEQFYDSVLRRDIATPIMGAIPPVPGAVADRTRKHIEQGTQAFCLDFARRKPTARRQLTEVLEPFHRERVDKLGTHGESLVYAINAHRGRQPRTRSVNPADDFIALGLGVDVLGCQHRGMLLPPDALDEDYDPSSFLRLFDDSDYVYRRYSPDEIPSALPAGSEMSPERVKKQLGSNKTSARSLLAAESMGVASRKLRAAIEDGTVRGHLRTKAGVDSDAVDQMKQVADTIATAGA